MKREGVVHRERSKDKQCHRHHRDCHERQPEFVQDPLIARRPLDAVHPRKILPHAHKVILDEQKDGKPHGKGEQRDQRCRLDQRRSEARPFGQGLHVMDKVLQIHVCQRKDCRPCAGEKGKPCETVSGNRNIPVVRQVPTYGSHNAEGAGKIDNHENDRNAQYHVGDMV
jgi:hypothetical protein